MAAGSVLVPGVGAAFGTTNLVARPAGAARIGGTSGVLDEVTAHRLRAGLGSTARLLDRRGDRLVADFDGCALDGDRLTSEAGLAIAIRDGALARVEGAFAIAWRDATGSIHLARDPIGHRALYYAVQGRELVFASHLRVLLDAFELPRRLDLRSLAAYLSCAYVPGRGTMVAEVFEVLPGESVTVVDGALVRTQFWDLPPEPPATAAFDEHTLREQLRAELDRVIAAALPTDAPVCASLSGGIDSSLVVAIAQRLHCRPVQTFSITFGREHRNELEHSSLVAAHVGTTHRIVELRADVVLAHLTDTVARMDKPNGDPLTVPNALLFREMAQHGSVALNGEGGDPCFGGPKNLPMLLAELYSDHADGDPEFARERSYLRAHLKCFDELRGMLTPEAYAQACTPPLEHTIAPWFADARWSSFLGTLLAINVRFKGGHHILPKVDALAEPFGVLPRSPLFAKSLVELAFTLPPALKLAGSVEKYLLKEAVRDLLPAAIVDRAKSGMLVPVEGWFQGPLAGAARTRILDGLGPRRIFRQAMLEQLLAGKNLGLRPRRGVKIWLLITLEAHLRALGIDA